MATNVMLLKVARVLLLLSNLGSQERIKDAVDSNPLLENVLSYWKHKDPYYCYRVEDEDPMVGAATDVFLQDELHQRYDELSTQIKDLSRKLEDGLEMLKEGGSKNDEKGTTELPMGVYKECVLRIPQEDSRPQGSSNYYAVYLHLKIPMVDDSIIVKDPGHYPCRLIGYSTKDHQCMNGVDSLFSLSYMSTWGKFHGDRVLDWNSGSTISLSGLLLAISIAVSLATILDPDSLPQGPHALYPSSSMISHFTENVRHYLVFFCFYLVGCVIALMSLVYQSLQGLNFCLAASSVVFIITSLVMLGFTIKLAVEAFSHSW